MLFTRRLTFETEDGSGQQKRDFAKDPAVIRLGKKYFLYFSTFDDSDRGKLRIGIAESADLEQWNFLSLLPLDDGCEKNGVGAPAAFVRDGRVHLFYQTYGNREKDAICHAVSDDGIRFDKDPTNPVFSPSADWCCGRAIDADVVPFGDKLFLYFATRDKDFKKQMVGAAYADLSSGYHREDWTQAKAAPILEPELEWEKLCIEAPAAIEKDGRIFLFYGGAYNCEPQQIGCAVSDNGIDFSRISDLPFLKNGNAGEWNASESGHPYVFEDEDGHIHLFYQGSPDGGKSWLLSRCRIVFENGKPVVAEKSDAPDKNQIEEDVF